MKPFKKSKIARSTTCRKEYKLVTNRFYKEPYWDEGLHFYPTIRWGYKNPIKQILSYQIRMYRSWKHNRKTQWK